MADTLDHLDGSVDPNVNEQNSTSSEEFQDPTGTPDGSTASNTGKATFKPPIPRIGKLQLLASNAQPTTTSCMKPALLD